MIGFAIRTAFRMLALAGALYLTFFVPLGHYTLYEHLSRIAATSEAQELGGSVSQAVKRAADGLWERLRGDSWSDPSAAAEAGAPGESNALSRVAASPTAAGPAHVIH